jgi:hypothetical protein
VASACSDTIGEGDFRARLAIELEHPSGTQYPLNDLPALWTYTRDWLKQHRSRYRQLKLPDPGRRDKRIGISKQLVFPSYKDYTALSRLLADTELDVDSSPLQIISILRSNRAKFSEPFFAIFDDFVTVYREQGSMAREHAFWSAVRSISWDSSETEAQNTHAVRYALHLSLADPSEPKLSLLVSHGLGNGHNQLIEVSPPIGMMKYQVSSASFEDMSSIFMRAPSLPDFARGLLYKGIRDGCICICEEETGERISCSVLPEEGNVFLALAPRNAVTIRQRFGSRIRPHYSETIPGTSWSLIGPVEAFDLRKIATELSEHDSIRCLLPRLTEPTIQFTGATRVGESYLFRVGTYPNVICPEADRITATVETARGELEIPLAAVPSTDTGPPHFAFPPHSFDTVSPPRAVLLTAAAGEREVAQRGFHACREVTSADYKCVVDSDRWLREGERGHLVSMTFQNYSEKVAGLRESSLIVPKSSGVIQQLGDSQGIERQSSTPITTMSPAWIGLLEVIAGRALARQGLSEGELFELVCSCLELSSQWLAWDIIRSLVENWHLDCFAARRWNGRRYFPIRPSLFVDEVSGKSWLLGLLPDLKRVQLIDVCERLSVTPVQHHDPIALTIGPVLLGHLSETTVATLAEKIGLSVRASGDSRLEPIPSMADVLRLTEPTWTVSSGGAEEATWNWRDGGFEEGISDSTVVLRRRRWWDRPEEYGVFAEGGQMSWITRSRTWALLVAHWFAKKPQFDLSREGTIRRLPGTQGHLPLPTARALCLAGSVAGGLHPRADGILTYEYSGKDLTQIKWICDSLIIHGTQRRRIPALERWRAAMPRPLDDLAPIAVQSDQERSIHAELIAVPETRTKSCW